MALTFFTVSTLACCEYCKNERADLDFEEPGDMLNDDDSTEELGTHAGLV